jgi:hypothetical protein
MPTCAVVESATAPADVGICRALMAYSRGRQESFPDGIRSDLTTGRKGFLPAQIEENSLLPSNPLALVITVAISLD